MFVYVYIILYIYIYFFCFSIIERCREHADSRGGDDGSGGDYTSGPRLLQYNQQP
jgi:hypothetical protein